MGLPPWATADRASIERQAARYRSLTPEERARELAAVCRAAARLVASRPDRAEILAHRDELPESSRRALARLREEYRSRRDRAR
jgi:hypothetical protein